MTTSKHIFTAAFDKKQISSRLITNMVGMFFAFCVFMSVPAHAGPFGPTGIEGSESKSTIKVTKTHEGSPAFGKLNKGDVIIALEGKKFGKSPKRDMAAAIDVAETRKAGGKLTLTLKGNKKVVLTLPVLGS